MVAPTTSSPASTSKAAATEESTPPDIATSTRSLTRPPHPGAECGVRNAEYQCEGRTGNDLPLKFRTPHSAFRTFYASSMQDRGQSPDLLDDLRQGSGERVHGLRRLLLAERQAQRPGPLVGRHPPGREHVARPDRPPPVRGPH